jgi:hypothetical protein
MPSANYLNRIFPGMVTVFELDADYRCERDLHHHLTSLFDKISPMRIGEKNTLVRYEMLTLGNYNWSGDTPSSGNIDIFFMASDEDANFNVPIGGTAIEINCNYTPDTKTKQDLIKLLDPLNHFGEAVYVVVGTERGMRRPVEIGFEDAIAHLAVHQGDRRFSLTKILLIEELGGWRFLYEGSFVEEAADVTIVWSEKGRRCLLSGDNGGDPMRLLAKEAAKALLQDRMRQEGIPLGSSTARCMFEPTKTKDGRQLCHFGKTPLWDHVLDQNEDRVAFAVFSHWLEKLAKYGKSRQ